MRAVAKVMKDKLVAREITPAQLTKMKHKELEADFGGEIGNAAHANCRANLHWPSTNPLPAISEFKNIFRQSH